MRELDNIVQRALILRTGSVITANDIIIDVQGALINDESEVSASEPEGLGEELKAQEHVIILETLAQCQGSRKLVAEKLGISARTLRYKMARMRDMGIQLPS